MGFAKITKIAFAAIVVATTLTGAASAQPFQLPLRWLGDGFSAGYHRCNPGPDVDYYNPWNAHNSRLISNLPQFQQQNYQSFNLNNIENRPIYQGVPFSVYAAPNRGGHGLGAYGFPNGYDQGSYQNVGDGDMVESTFEPFEEEELEEELEEEDLQEELREDVEEDLEDWQEDENEWMEDEIEDDSASHQRSGQSVFSNASFPNQIQNQGQDQGQDQGQIVPLLEGNSQAPNLFNPFPGQ